MTRALYVGSWRIDLTVRDGVDSPISGAAVSRAIAAALTSAGATTPASIGLILSDDAELAGLNADHLGVQGSTDVLSFPLLAPEAFPPHPGTAVRSQDRASAPAFPLPPGRRQHLGDIVISVERAIEQAETGRGGQTGDVRWSAADEMRLLATHGALHICGWDHAEPAEESAMRALETTLLTQSRSADRPPGRSQVGRGARSRERRR